ncbi:MAG: hypothetical protein WC444_04655 [Candidatus Paceibacterota bacterium]
MKVQAQEVIDQPMFPLEEEHPLEDVEGVSVEPNEITEDSALTIAKTYWMMGYNWLEIEMLLKDRHYPESMISKAVKAAQAYAKEMLSNGPFAGAVNGQYVKLKNGMWGVAAQLTPKQAVLTLEDGTKLKTEIEHIDVEATKLLAESFKLRKQAELILNAIPKEYVIPEMEGQPDMEVDPDIQESYKSLVQERAPAGWSEISPEIGEAEPVHAVLHNVINNLEGLRALKDELQKSIKKVKDEQLMPLQEQFKALAGDEQQELRNAFMIVEQMEDGLSEIDKTIFRDYEGELVGFQNKIVENPMPPTVADELDALKKIIAENHKKIAPGIFAALEQFMEANTKIERELQKTFAKYPYRKRPKKGQLVEKVTGWFKGLWKSLSKTITGLYETVLPEAEEATEAVQEMNRQLDSYLKTAAVKKIVKG